MPTNCFLAQIPIVSDPFGMWNFSQRKRALSGTCIIQSDRRKMATRHLSSKCHSGEANMTFRKILAAAAAMSLIALPAMAQTSSDTEKNGHHYQGGPKTEVPHHMGKKETVGVATKTQRTGGHHYRGGPATSAPHHMGDEQQ
jgi:hypothetical protein